MEPEELARRVDPISAGCASMIRDRRTKILQYATPFFSHASVYFIQYPGPYRYHEFSIGCAGPDYTVALTMNPQGFQELAARGGLRLDSVPQRIRYVTVLLDSTHDFMRRWRILDRFDDIPLRNQPKPQEVERFRQLREKYEPVIKPPACTKRPPFHVTVYAVCGLELVRYVALVSDDGKVDVRQEVLEERMPIRQ